MPTLSHILLPKCEFCGRVDCIAHKKYTDRCEECGKRYAKYSSYRSLQRKEYSGKRAALLVKLEAEYIDLRNAGYKVPRDLQKQRT